MLKLFETGKSHMAVLTRPPGEAVPGGKGGRRGSPWVSAPRPGASSSWMRSAFESADAQHGLGDSEAMPPRESEEPVGIITIEDVIEEVSGHSTEQHSSPQHSTACWFHL